MASKKNSYICKLIPALLLAFVLSFTFQSCQKDEEIAVKEDSHLKVATIPDYFTALIDAIETYVEEGIISEGIGNSLISKVNNAIKSAENGNIKAALNQLKAVTNAVNALVNAGTLTELLGSELTDKVEDAAILTNGSFTDARDGNEYPVVLIGEQIWLAKNLAFLPQVSPPQIVDNYVSHYYYVYGYYGYNVTEAKALDTYKISGVLYNWTAANTSCPSGWHLPSDAEWKQLEIFLGMTLDEVNKFGQRGFDEGSKLKSTTGWGSSEANGTNTSGFTAIPGGYRYVPDGIHPGRFDMIQGNTAWWTSTNSEETGIYRHISYGSQTVTRWGGIPKGMGYSVRCIKE